MMQKKNNGAQSEIETRQGIIKQALRFYGPEAARQVQAHFVKYDGLLARVTNESERKHIKHLALAELYKMMGYYQGLVVGGQEIIPPNLPSEKKEE
jgi:hypothetical protein